MLEGEVGRCGERDEERVESRERCASPSAGLRAFLLEGEGGICGVLKDKDLNMVEVEGMGLGDVGWEDVGRRGEVVGGEEGVVVGREGGGEGWERVG